MDDLKDAGNEGHLWPNWRPQIWKCHSHQHHKWISWPSPSLRNAEKVVVWLKGNNKQQMIPILTLPQYHSGWGGGEIPTSYLPNCSKMVYGWWVGYHSTYNFLKGDPHWWQNILTQQERNITRMVFLHSSLVVVAAKFKYSRSTICNCIYRGSRVSKPMWDKNKSFKIELYSSTINGVSNLIGDFLKQEQIFMNYSTKSKVWRYPIRFIL